MDAGQDFIKTSPRSGYCLAKKGSKTSPDDGLSDLDRLLRDLEKPTRKSRSRKRWGALAASIWHDDSGGVNVALGMGWNKSEGDARQTAVDGCYESEGKFCVIKHTWTSGCYYAASGRNPNGLFRKGNAGWVAGANYSEVKSRCRSKYKKCNKPIGGCIK